MGKEQTVPTIVENFEVDEEVQKLKKELTKNKKRKLEESMEQREEIKNLTKEKKKTSKNWKTARCREQISRSCYK